MPGLHCPPNEFGDLPDTPYDTRQHSQYATAYHKSNLHVLESDGVKRINNALWHLPNLEPHTLFRGIPCTHFSGMLTHLMKWIQEFLDHVGRLTVFDHIWSRLPPFPEFTRPNKAYRSVTQWQGKEMRNLLWVLLAVFTAVLTRRSDAILCVRYLTDFILIAQYKVHTSGTI
ncbi:hypothetical protein BGX38DRAFT_1189143 [Terfezia claveryi]|nr:hypothetical protein BGX38DRAFT_1189143 [Terfezia claveryi]